MAYKITELSTLNDYFRSCFGIGFKPFYNKILSPILCEIQIDIVLFDEWLHKEHGNYELENKSMNDILLLYYGEPAIKLINELS